MSVKKNEGYYFLHLGPKMLLTLNCLTRNTNERNTPGDPKLEHPVVSGQRRPWWGLAPVCVSESVSEDSEDRVNNFIPGLSRSSFG